MTIYQKMEFLFNEASLLRNSLRVEAPEYPVANLETDVSPVFLVFVRLFQEENTDNHAEYDDDTADDVR